MAKALRLRADSPPPPEATLPLQSRAHALPLWSTLLGLFGRDDIQEAQAELDRKAEEARRAAEAAAAERLRSAADAQAAATRAAAEQALREAEAARVAAEEAAELERQAAELVRQSHLCSR